MKQRGKATKLPSFSKQRAVHANSIEIECMEGDKFWTLVDNSLYGPYRKVRLVPCRLDKKAVYAGSQNSSPQLSIPIRTFFPIHDPATLSCQKRAIGWQKSTPVEAVLKRQPSSVAK